MAELFHNFISGQANNIGFVHDRLPRLLGGARSVGFSGWGGFLDGEKREVVVGRVSHFVSLCVMRTTLLAFQQRRPSRKISCVVDAGDR